MKKTPKSERSELSMFEFDPNLTQQEFDYRFFEQVLSRNADHIDVLRRMAEIFSRRGQHAQAVPLDKRLAQLLPHDSVVHYNLACSLACTDCIAEALQALAHAIEYGYDDLTHMETDADLEALRNEPRYRELVEQCLHRLAKS